MDPTLLLSKEDYIELFVGKNLPDNKGIYTYILDDSDWKTQVVETAKQTLGLPQFSNQHNKHTVNSEKIPSIESWIKGFAYADFVITDSFHGTVFSIIFNKPFISLVNINRGASRFESILSEFGLLHRLIDKFEHQKITGLLEHNVDKEVINSKLEELKSKSLDLLNNSISKS